MAGSARGRWIAVPPGAALRPTPDRVREALFSILGSLEGLLVLDLFAGTGALGLEALSRGARRAVFVESDAATARCIEANAETLGFRGHGHVLRASLPRALDDLAASADRFDVVLADPPFASDLGARILACASLDRLLAPAGRIVVEHPARTDLGPCRAGFTRADQRRYGTVGLSFYRRNAEETG